MGETINLDKDILESAKFSASKVDDKYLRKRAFALNIAANAAAKFLNEKELKISVNHSLYKSPAFAKEIELADIYSGEARFDVRVTFNDKTFCVPKSHTKYDVKPCAYIVVKLGANLEQIEFLGFVPENELNYPKSDSEYFTFSTDKLKPVDDFVDYAKGLKIPPHKYDEKEHENIKEICVNFIDNQANEADKIYFIKHVATCPVCRETFRDMNDFDDIVSQLKNYKELLNDSTLSVLSGNRSEVDQAVMENIALVENAQEDEPESSLVDSASIIGAAAAGIAGVAAAEAASGVEAGLVIGEAAVEAMNGVENVEPSTDTTDELPEAEDMVLEDFHSEAISLEEEPLDELLDVNTDEMEAAEPQELTLESQELPSEPEELSVEPEELPLETETEDEILEEFVTATEEPVADAEETAEPADETELLDETTEPADEITESAESLETVEFAEPASDTTDELPETEDIVLLEDFHSEAISLEEEPLDELLDVNTDEMEAAEPQELTLESQELPSEPHELSVEPEELPLETETEEEILEEFVTETEEPVADADEIELADETDSIEEVLEETELEPAQSQQETPVQDEPLEQVDELEQSSDALELDDLDTLDSLEPAEEISYAQTPVELKYDDEDEMEDAVEPAEIEQFEHIEPEQISDSANVEHAEYEQTPDEANIEQAEQEQQSEPVVPAGQTESAPAADEDLQELLDDDLLALLSDDDEDTASVSGAQDNASSEIYSQENYSPENIAQENSSQPAADVQETQAVDLNDDVKNLYDGQEIPAGENVELDISREPVSEETIQKTKKLAVSAALIMLLAIGGGAGAWYIHHKNTVDKEAMDSASGDQLFDFQNKGENADSETPAAALPQDINKSMTNSFSDKPAAISITKLSWQISEKLAVEPSVKEYLQTAGKNIQMNLQNDLANAADIAFNNSVKVSFEIAPDNTMKGIQVLESSGSDKIDEIITKSIKNTLKYVSVPKLQNYKSDYFLTLIINF